MSFVNIKSLNCFLEEIDNIYLFIYTDKKIIYLFIYTDTNLFEVAKVNERAAWCGQNWVSQRSW